MKKNKLFKKGEIMKLNKKQKVISSLIGGVAVLGLSLGIAIPLLRDKSTESAPVKETIKSKIKEKNLVIPKNVDTYSDSEISLAIKNQLKLKNPSLTKDDLSKITDNVWHLKPGKKTPVILKIKLENKTDSVSVNVTKEKNIKMWTKDSAIVTRSNIISGTLSSFMQDSSGNLWSMGAFKQVTRNGKGLFGRLPNGRIIPILKHTKLQVLKRDGTQWQDATNTGLTKSSNIFTGMNGSIFEDDFGNLWAMGMNRKLQVLVKNKDGTYASSWVNNNHAVSGAKLLKNSRLRNGNGGVIFQDSFGNLWAMGTGSSLQVLVKNKDGTYADSWNYDNTKELLKNSNVVNRLDSRYTGKYGAIFQDKFNNLWAMGKNSKLQVLKADPNSDSGYVTTGWINDNSASGDSLLKGSNISIGYKGTIFQDSFGNLWMSGGGQKVQVLKVKSDGSGYVNTGWTSDNNDPLLKGSNIDVVRNSSGRAVSGNAIMMILQDSFGNLWIHGEGVKPQVLEAKSDGSGYVDAGWKNNNHPNTGHKLLKNLKISATAGNNLWTFFQDSSKNLWAMGNNTKLQVLKAKSDGSGYVDAWTDDNSASGEALLKESNVTNGNDGTIFEDSSKNLWVMGYGTKLQVYDKTQKKWID